MHVSGFRRALFFVTYVSSRDLHLLRRWPRHVGLPHMLDLVRALYKSRGTEKTSERALATDDPTMDELKVLPYLDMVVRESLWLHSPFFFTRRVAVKDAVLPMGDGSSIKCVSH